MKKLAKLKQVPSSLRIKIIVGAVTILSLLNAGAIAYVLHRENTRTDNTIAILIDKAIDNLTTPATLDPQSKRQFIPEANLVLPAINDRVGRVSYSYSPDYIGVSSDNDVSQAISQMYGQTPDLTKIFEKVPRLQACARGVTVNTQRDEFTTEQKTLSDGRIVYLSMDRDCVNNDLFNYVKQINSY